MSPNKMPTVVSRVSILLKAAEIIIRNDDSLKRNDIIYYLEQIIKEAEECLLLLDAPRKADFK